MTKVQIPATVEGQLAEADQILAAMARTDAALRAENQRLRSTLQFIADGYLGDQTAEQQFIWAQQLARRALDQKRGHGQ